MGYKEQIENILKDLSNGNYAFAYQIFAERNNYEFVQPNDPDDLFIDMTPSDIFAHVDDEYRATDTYVHWNGATGLYESSDDPRDLSEVEDDELADYIVENGYLFRTIDSDLDDIIEKMEEEE